MRDLVAIAVGYLLGSILPAYLIGRARGVDLTKAGSGNAGTTNALHVLGIGPAVVTGAYDFLKGILAMLVAWRLLGASEPFVYAAGVAAWAGHHFPFYLGYHGAEGAATTAGLLVASLAIAFQRGWVALPDAIVVAVVALGLLAIFKRWPAADVAGLSVALVILLARSTSLAFDLFAAFAFLHQIVHNVAEIRRTGQLRASTATRRALSHVRVLLRPAALALPVLYLFLPQRTMLLLVGALALAFATLDAARLVSRRFGVAALSKLSFLFLPGEERTFSSATLLLLATFLAFFLFPKPEATLAVVFVVLGDLFARYVGLEHGRVRVFGKTAEGALAYFVVCVLAGFAWARLVPLSPAEYLLGAAVAALAELLPLRVDDDFLVPLLSGAAMTLPSVLGVPGF